MRSRRQAFSRISGASLLVNLALLAATATVSIPLARIAVGAPVSMPAAMPWMPSGSPDAQTTDYSSFQLNPAFGGGALEFEGNSAHVYNYTLGGQVATFNASVDASVIAPPTVYDGLLLVDLSQMSGSGMGGGVAAIDLENGQMVWKTTVPNQMMTQPITYDGLVIIGLGNKDFQNSSSRDAPKVRGTGTNYVAALNATTGDLVWSYPTQGEDMPTPLISKDLVVGVNGDGVVYALDPLTGQAVWHTELPKGSYVSMSSPAISDGSMFFGAALPFDFYSLNLTTGAVSWSTPTPANGGLDDCSPAVSGGVVVSGYTQETSTGLMQPVLFGMNETTGQVLWRVQENPGPKPPAIEVPPITIANGVAYSDPTESGTLYAVNATTGALLWSFKTGPDTSNAQVYDGYVSVVNTAGMMFVIDPATGALARSTEVGVGLGPGSLVFANQEVIMGGSSGLVRSIPVAQVYPAN